MNTELLNTIIAASTSVFVVILSQILIRQKEKKQALENENGRLLKKYINPMRFMLAENYYRLYEIMKKEEKRNSLLFINEPIDIMEKDRDWFVKDGCYLMSTCYFTACLFAYMRNIQDNVPFLTMICRNDTKLIKLINKLVIDFSSDLNIYYVIQMNIGKECYIKDEERVLTYREFCELFEDKENFIWYQSLVKYFLRIGNGEYRKIQYLLEDIKELSAYLDNIVSGGNSIEQKMLAENEGEERKDYLKSDYI